MTKSKQYLFALVVGLAIGGGYIAMSGHEPVEPKAAVKAEPKADTQHIALLYRLGDASVESGLATTYDVSGWHSQLNLHISSLLPGDARTINEAVCNEARKYGELKSQLRGWEIRTFILASDETPAAVCRL